MSQNLQNCQNFKVEVGKAANWRFPAATRLGMPHPPESCFVGFASFVIKKAL